VGMLLQGSVRSAGDRIRVTAQLIAADSGFHVWSQTYDRRFADVFELQDELAGAIVHALKINLGDREGRPLRDVPPTKDVEAYRLYLRAIALRDTFGASERAISLLNECTARDPTFVRAHAQLAVAYNFLYSVGTHGPEALLEAQRSAERALSLDPNAAEAHAVIGVQHGSRGEWILADNSLRRAMELDPLEPLTHTTYALFVLGPGGKLEQAAAEARRAYELAPGTTGAAINVAGFSFLSGHSEDAAHFVQAASELGARGEQLPIALFRAEIARRSGEYAAAPEPFIKVLPEDVRARGGEELVRLIYAALADSRHAPRALAGLRALRGGDELPRLGKWPMILMLICWFTWLGALDDAHDAAQRIVQGFRRTGVLNVITLGPLWMREMLPFRRDERFQGFARELGLFDYWRERGPPEGCELKGERLILR